MAIVIKWSSRGRADQFVVKPKEKIKIGRSSKSDVQIPDGLCSSVHFEIEYTKDGQLMVRDLDSKNGVYINDIKILEENFYLQDEIKVGGTKFFITPSDLTEDQRNKLNYVGDPKERFSQSMQFKVEEVPYEPRGTRRTKDLIEEKYNLNASRSLRKPKKPTNYKKLAVYLVLLAVSTAIFYYWFSSRYRILI